MRQDSGQFRDHRAIGQAQRRNLAARVDRQKRRTRQIAGLRVEDHNLMRDPTGHKGQFDRSRPGLRISVQTIRHPSFLAVFPRLYA